MTRKIVPRTTDSVLNDTKNRVRVLEATPGDVGWEDVGGSGSACCYPEDFFSAQVYGSNNEIVNNTETALDDWSASSESTSNGYVHIDFSGSVFTPQILQTGLYMMTLDLCWDSAFTGKRYAKIALTGATSVPFTPLKSQTATEGDRDILSVMVQVTVTSSPASVVPYAYQNSGGNKFLTGGVTNSSFSIVLIAVEV